MVRRRRRHLVVMRAVILVAAEHREPRGIRILPRVRDPQPAAFVETEMKRLRDLRFIEDELDAQILGRGHLRRRLRRWEARSRNLLRPAEHAVRLTKTVERRHGRFVRPRATRLVPIARPELPRARENALPKIVHDERRVAQESGRALARRLVNPDRDLIPLAFAQRADGHFVPVDRRAAALVRGWEGTAGPDLHPIHPGLERALEFADVQPHRLLEQIAVMLREEAVVHLHPGPVPRRVAGRSDLLCGGGIPRSRDFHRAPLGAQRGNDRKAKQSKSEQTAHTKSGTKDRGATKPRCFSTSKRAGSTHQLRNVQFAQLR